MLASVERRIELLRPWEETGSWSYVYSFIKSLLLCYNFISLFNVIHSIFPVKMEVHEIWRVKKLLKSSLNLYIQKVIQCRYTCKRIYYSVIKKPCRSHLFHGIVVRRMPLNWYFCHQWKSSTNIYRIMICKIFNLTDPSQILTMTRLEIVRCY